MNTEKPFEIKVIELMTGDTRVVYSGNSRKDALRVFEGHKKEKDCEVEYYINGILKFWYNT